MISSPADTSQIHWSSDPDPIIFIYDASGSMWGQMQGRTKVEIAREVLSETIDQLASNQPIGFVAYGHRQKGDCEDVEFMVNPSNNSRQLVKEKLQGIRPLGKTPLAYSALQVIESLKKTGTKATVILLTDGIESCGGDLCAVVQSAREAGLAFRLHIVGFGLEGEDLEDLKCAAQAGQGQYYDASDAEELSDVLEDATSQTLEAATHNLGIFATKNGEPIDAWVKAYPSGTDQDAGGVRTYRDTGFVALPPGNYDLEVQPLESSDVKAQRLPNVEIPASSMVIQTVRFDAGKIKVHTLMNGEGWDATVKIFQSGDPSLVSGGRTYGQSTFFDVSPGQYDLTLRGLKIHGLHTVHTVEGVRVLPGDTLRIQHEFETGVARIGAKEAGELIDVTVKIAEVSTGESVAGGRTYTSSSSNPKEFLLNPGTYQVTLGKVGDYTGKPRTFEMSIRKGATFEKMMEF